MTQIMIVDDSPTDTHLLKKILEKNGFTTLTAADASKGIEVAKREQPDLILMDENMPRMNGIEATRKIRGIEKRLGIDDPVPVIALTANAVAGDRERLLAAGMDEYISKPVNPDTLIRAIATLLNKWS